MLLTNKPSRLLMARISAIGLLLFFQSNTAVSRESDWGITSESSVFDLANRVLRYTGNAKFTSENVRVAGNQIETNSKNRGETESIKISGHPAHFTFNDPSNKKIDFTAENINYVLKTESINARGNIELNLRENANNQVKISSQKLSFASLPSGLLTAYGNPLEVTISQPESTLKATASELVYNQKTQQFELTGKVKLTTERETIKAHKIHYNGETRVMQIPKSPNQQVEMTQNKKKEQ
ncbi:LptA/OstA family protein [Aliikangiella coralliicola]|uniref:Organic solvent tolerance-like N-terminal domain-containing protein n=1 Tax=Aliikangiella coralliicola TaxID=2592383 RepID=A0A545UJZ8_9GAMM|nr:LptA/OstA family protein [Aliikangiella coralliicola]TQV89788.1 hypothetical protein FLL46_02600 [Aliikangiella coralliicola]